jgi:RNA polymerase sigma factor (sigma-70 family)
MVRQSAITQDNFDKLLAWLDADCDRAGNRYEEIRQSLIKIFTWRGCNEAEDMADEVINRVAKKVPELAAIYKGDPALYFYGIAKNVLLEYRLQEKRYVQLTEAKEQELAYVPGEGTDIELLHECLTQCLQKLSPQNRETVTTYYQRNKQAKIDNRKEIAQQMGVAINNLRVRMHRIRATLEQCIKSCLEQSS